jgi:hypothetical protein
LNQNLPNQNNLHRRVQAPMTAGSISKGREGKANHMSDPAVLRMNTEETRVKEENNPVV